ncbi:MAG: hypothetical protein AB1757_19120 [Acidobacteriota bacterium]
MAQNQADATLLESLRESGDYKKLAEFLPNSWRNSPEYNFEAIRLRLLAAELASRIEKPDELKTAMSPFLRNIDKAPFALAGRVLLGCANYYHYFKDYQQSLKFSSQAEAAAFARDDEWTQAEAHYLKTLALHELTDWDKSLVEIQEAILLFSEQARLYRLGLAYLTKGIILNRLGRIEEANTALFKSLKLLAKFPDYQSQAIARFHLAKTFSHQGEFSNAYQQLLFAHEIFETTGNEYDYLTLTELVLMLTALKDFDEAKYFICRALNSSQANLSAGAKAYAVKAEYHLARREFEEAGSAVRISLDYATQNKNKLQESEAKKIYGKICLSQKLYEDAARYLETALDLARELQEPLVIVETKALLAQAICEANPSEAFSLLSQVEAYLEGRELNVLKKIAQEGRKQINAIEQEHFFVLSDAHLPQLADAREAMLKWMWARSLFQAKGNAAKAASIIGVTPTYIRKLTKEIPRDLLRPKKKRTKKGL